MHIGIDIRCFVDGARTGVEEYTTGVLEKLFEEDQENQYLLFINAHGQIKTDLAWLEKYPNVRIKRFHLPNKILNFCFWYLGWPHVDQLLGGVDIFFAPNISFLSISQKCKFVLTIHDLSFERFPEHFSFYRKFWHYLINPRKLCQRADKILAVSDSTKQDLNQLYGIDQKKISLVTPIKNLARFPHHIPSETDLLKVKKKYNLPKKYILYLGTIEPRKNIISLVKAFELLKKHETSVAKDCQLVIAGRLGWSYDQIIQKINQSPFHQEIKLTGFIDDVDKSAVYRGAEVFVYPSFFEGFGFPPLEAMASGVPVITSHCSSLPEATDGAGILIDPYEPNDIYLALKELLSSPSHCHFHIQKGFDRARDLLEKIEKENVLRLITEIEKC